MSLLSNMTRSQKEQYVIELYKQDKTTREIAQRAHMSPRDIGVIIKKVKAEVQRESGETEEEFDNIRSKSKESQAFKMFSEGEDPVDVVIALDIPADEVRAIYLDYWGLNDMHKLVEVYEEIRPYLSSVLRLHKVRRDGRTGNNKRVGTCQQPPITTFAMESRIFEKRYRYTGDSKDKVD
jgi:hypothetical protein